MQKRSGIENYYVGEQGNAYFQGRAARRGPALQKKKAESLGAYLDKEWDILDFGCGTGDILACIDCRARFGVEINPPSIEAATANGLTVFRSLDEVESNRMDAVLAYHSLEHVADPTTTIAGLHRVLRHGGRTIIVVPAECPWSRNFDHWYEESNKHLFSWTPLSLGNLVGTVGFRVEQAFVRLRPTDSKYLRHNIATQPVQRLLTRVRGWMLERYETVCIARKI